MLDPDIEDAEVERIMCRYAIIRIFSLLVLIIFICSVFLMSCTISLQNISTHGSATDLVDENQNATSELDTDLTGGL